MKVLWCEHLARYLDVKFIEGGYNLIKLTQIDAASSITGRLTKTSALFSNSAKTDKTD